MNVIETLEKEEATRLIAGKKIPAFQPGDTLRVNVKIKEGERERVQAYEGVCIARSGGGLQENFTVRKISFGEGVERVFPVLSPMIESIEVSGGAQSGGRNSIICGTGAGNQPESRSAPRPAAHGSQRPWKTDQKDASQSDGVA
jgi:large subunit ribosomal protein L19